jgi:PA domain
MNHTTHCSKLIRSLVFAIGAIALSAGAAAAGPAQFVIVNTNAPGVGFNDPTAAAPVGGNTGTTVGEQRLIAFKHAAGIWSLALDSTVPIRIRAQMIPLPPNVLGNAGALDAFSDFPNAPLSNTWYHVALANKLAGMDLNTGDGTPANSGDDIAVNFSIKFNFYLGLDGNHGAQNDLVAVLLHEFGHGVGFSQFANLTTGALPDGLPDAYNTKLLDTSVGLYWPQMTNAQRAASATRFGRVVWDGANVTAGVPHVLSFGSPVVQVLSPLSIAGPYQFGTAAFGPAIGSPNVSAAVVAAVDPADAAGATSTDGCSAFSNAAAVAGRIALVERGTCGFAVKARNAAAAGAGAVIIYNNAANAATAPPGMAADAGPAVTIPAVSLTRGDGLAIVGQLAGGVSATIGVDLTIRAGADALNRARVYAPFPVVGGSSISHYDTVASRNLLMEPNISPDLTHNVKAPFDLTLELLTDVGWYPDADGDLVPDAQDCNAHSDRRPTIVIGSIDTGVPNVLFASGCTSSDLIARLNVPGANHGSFVSAVAELTNQWVAEGILTGRQKGALQSAAARQ